MTYKHSNGHIQRRSSGGQFRRTTLGDFNTGTRICPKCGAINPYALKQYKRENGFVEVVSSPPPETCAHCEYRFTGTD